MGENVSRIVYDCVRTTPYSTSVRISSSEVKTDGRAKTTSRRNQTPNKTELWCRVGFWVKSLLENIET